MLHHDWYFCFFISIQYTDINIIVTENTQTKKKQKTCKVRSHTCKSVKIQRNRFRVSGSLLLKISNTENKIKLCMPRLKDIKYVFF